MNWDSACAAGFWWRIYIVRWCWLNGWRASWMRYAFAFYESNLLTSPVSVSLCMWMFVYLIPLFSFSFSITKRFPYLFFTKHTHAYTVSISFFHFSHILYVHKSPIVDNFGMFAYSKYDFINTNSTISFSLVLGSVARHLFLPIFPFASRIEPVCLSICSFRLFHFEMMRPRHIWPSGILK